MTTGGGGWFQRYVLPGLAFKAVVIGGGYATGRELVEFFLVKGPSGGLLGMMLAMVVWSLVCAATFLFAFASASYDYRAFFKALLGPFWGVFEAAYVLFLVVVLAVFGAAAGEIGQGLFGWPEIIGAVALAVAIAAVTAYGNAAVERLFKYVSVVLYGVYALFLGLSLWRFGDRIADGFAAPALEGGWALGGLTYAGYNVVGAVAILPVVRHFARRREAVVAGLLCGPLAILPGVLFFVCMAAYYPQIAGEALPSDYLLQRLGLPLFHLAFQLMIFAALLECGAGLVHAINERADAAHHARTGRPLGRPARLLLAGAILGGSIFLAGRFGLVTLIAKGYGALAWVILAIYVLPLATVGLARLARGGPLAREAP